MKKAFYIAVLLVFFQNYAQNRVAQFKIDLRRKKEVLQIVDEAKKEVSLFVADKEGVTVMRLNEKLNVIDSVSTVKLDKKYSQIGGTYFVNQNPTLLWFNKKKTEAAIQIFDLKSKKVESKTFTVPLENDIVVNSITIQNNFYLVTVSETNNYIRFFKFGTDGSFKTEQMDLSKYNFTGKTMKSTLYDILYENVNPFNINLNSQNISTETPCSLTSAARKRKWYVQGNSLILTIDSYSRYTEVCTFDLTNFTFDKKTIKAKLLDKDIAHLSELNSMLVDNTLVQLKMNTDQMFVSIKNLSGEILQEYAIEKSKSIEFKNSDFYSESGQFSSKRTFKETSSFIRKSNFCHMGVSCFKNNDKFLLTIGGVYVDENRDAIVMSSAFAFGVFGGLLAAAITSNSNVDNLSSYKNLNVMYFHSQFDNNWNHTSNEVKELAFDKARGFIEKDYFKTGITLFKFLGDLYTGSYDSKTNDYSFYKFTEQ